MQQENAELESKTVQLQFEKERLEEDLRLAEERYRVGKARLLEVLDAQVNLTQVRGDLVRTRYDLKIAEAELARLTGSI